MRRLVSMAAPAFGSSLSCILGPCAGTTGAIVATVPGNRRTARFGHRPNLCGGVGSALADAFRNGPARAVLLNDAVHASAKADPAAALPPQRPIFRSAVTQLLPPNC